MNITKINTEVIFPGVESKISKFGTFMLQITFWGILVLFFCLFVVGPAYGIYKRGFQTMLSTALICWAISLFILIPVTRQYIIKRKSIARRIVVDSTGILFYNSKNEITEKILYTALRPSKQNFDVYTISPIGSGIAPLLEITVQPEKKNESTQRIDMNLPFRIVKNKPSLYAHFMHGISVFRPDLRIDPSALKSFSVNSDTWKVDHKGVSLAGWLLILMVLLITCVIIGFVILLAETKKMI